MVKEGLVRFQGNEGLQWLTSLYWIPRFLDLVAIITWQTLPWYHSHLTRLLCWIELLFSASDLCWEVICGYWKQVTERVCTSVFNYSPYPTFDDLINPLSDGVLSEHLLSCMIITFGVSSLWPRKIGAFGESFTPQSTLICASLWKETWQHMWLN